MAERKHESGPDVKPEAMLAAGIMHGLLTKNEHLSLFSAQGIVAGLLLYATIVARAHGFSTGALHALVDTIDGDIEVITMDSSKMVRAAVMERDRAQAEMLRRAVEAVDAKADAIIAAAAKMAGIPPEE